MKSRFKFRKNLKVGPNKLGILLTNLGTPNAPTAKALRPYLKEFLWDRRVVEIPRAIWWFILNGIVLNTRPKKSAALYESVWTSQGSPLLINSLDQADKLRSRLPSNTALEVGMRYGSPPIADALGKLLEADVTHLLILPLYPQYSGSTGGSTFDAIGQALKDWRWVPQLRFISDYHASPAYITAMAKHLLTQWQEKPRAPLTIFSFHGLPQHFIDHGDPYEQHCHTTAKLLANELGLTESEWQLTFQSRLGKAPWLKPYTDTTMKALPTEGQTEVDVFCPGFASDCLETLEEIAEENKGYFIDAGGEQYRYISALNAEEVHIDMLLSLINSNTHAWLD